MQYQIPFLLLNPLAIFNFILQHDRGMVNLQLQLGTVLDGFVQLTLQAKDFFFGFSPLITYFLLVASKPKEL